MSTQPTEDLRSIHRIIDRLDRIFENRLNDWGRRNRVEAYAPLLYAVLRGEVKIEPVRFPIDVIKGAYARKDRLTYNRSMSCWHQFMQEIAFQWLGGRNTDARKEYRNFGGIVDVASPEKKIVVECGNTNLGPCIQLLTFDSDWAYHVMPYQWASDRWYEDGRGGNIYAFKFTGRIREDDFWDAQIPFRCVSSTHAHGRAE